MKDLKRIEEATSTALYEFWAKIADAFPEAHSGDIDPLACFQFEEEARKIVGHWVDWNTQCECFQCCSEGHCGCSECKEPCTC